MTIDEQLANWKKACEAAVANFDSEASGSIVAGASDCVLLCRTALPRTIAAIEAVKLWRDEVMKSYDGGYGISHHDIRELDDILAKLAGEV